MWTERAPLRHFEDGGTRAIEDMRPAPSRLQLASQRRVVFGVFLGGDAHGQLLRIAEFDDLQFDFCLRFFVHDSFLHVAVEGGLPWTGFGSRHLQVTRLGDCSPRNECDAGERSVLWNSESLAAWAASRGGTTSVQGKPTTPWSFGAAAIRAERFSSDGDRTFAVPLRCLG